MMDGLFQIASLATPKTHIPLVPQCSSCKLHLSCHSPKMKPFGKGKRKILVCGESPGKNEDREGRPFVGQSGQRLRQALSELKVNLDRDCLTTNVVVCRTSKKSDEGNIVNRTPTNNEIKWCRPNVINTIKSFKPDILLLLGGSAVKSVLGWLWKEDPGTMERWRGWCIPNQQLNCWVCPAWHPSFLERSGNDRKAENPVMSLLWQQDLQGSLNRLGKPWHKVPDFKKRLRLIYDTDEASRAIRKMYLNSDVPLAFDLECTGLKPDNSNLFIYSCSLSNGIESIAFPWQGRAITEMKLFLQSDLSKIGFSQKYESRWLLVKHGIRVRKWNWDGMLAAHILDNRPGITGLKFQSFVLLGQESYDDEIKPYLKAETSNTPNRIQECPLDLVLKYNAMDSLLEWHVAQVQKKLLRFPFVQTECTDLYNIGESDESSKTT